MISLASYFTRLFRKESWCVKSDVFKIAFYGKLTFCWHKNDIFGRKVELMVTCSDSALTFCNEHDEVTFALESKLGRIFWVPSFHYHAPNIKKFCGCRILIYDLSTEIDPIGLLRSVFVGLHRQMLTRINESEDLTKPKIMFWLRRQYLFQTDEPLDAKALAKLESELEEIRRLLEDDVPKFPSGEESE